MISGYFDLSEAARNVKPNVIHSLNSARNPSNTTSWAAEAILGYILYVAGLEVLRNNIALGMAAVFEPGFTTLSLRGTQPEPGQPVTVRRRNRLASDHIKALQALVLCSQKRHRSRYDFLATNTPRKPRTPGESIGFRICFVALMHHWLDPAHCIRQQSALQCDGIQD